MTGAKTFLLPEGSRLAKVMHKGRSRKLTKQVQLGFMQVIKVIYAIRERSLWPARVWQLTGEQELTVCYQVPVLTTVYNSSSRESDTLF